MFGKEQEYYIYCIYVENIGNETAKYFLTILAQDMQNITFF